MFLINGVIFPYRFLDSLHGGPAIGKESGATLDTILRKAFIEDPED